MNFLQPAYLTKGNTGYAERMFSHTCEKCSFLIDRNKLAVAKFAHDFVMDPTNTRDVEKYGNALYLPYVATTAMLKIPHCNYLVEHSSLAPERLVH